MPVQNLVLFTLEFPYGKGETFLETEVNILASNFLQIYIIPSEYPADHQRLKFLPDNVRVVQIFKYSHKSIPILKTLVSNPMDALRVYFYELTSRDRQKYRKYFKSLLHYLAQDLHKKKRIKEFVRANHLDNALYYDYWFINSMISLSLLKHEGVIRKLICRAHGFDLYDDRQYEEVVSFRNFKIKYVDRVFLISQNGYDYLAKKISRPLKNKLELSYLGVNFLKSHAMPVMISKQIVFVSCARLLDFKRVHMIPLLFEKLDLPLQIKWIHFGEGPYLDKLNETIAKTKIDITFEYRGMVSNLEIHKFYQNNYVDFFISLSTREGLPVSMMEACAYGIPIIATCVNGVGEIVTSETGIQLMAEDSIEQMSITVKNRINKAFDRSLIRRHFEKHFDARTNYQKFGEKLLALTE